MKVIGVDTSSKFLCIGCFDGSRVYEYRVEAGRRMSLLIAVSIERVLDALGWEPADVDYFACGTGPGSFTGVRIGMATVKGLSWSLQKPVVAVSSLELVARNVEFGPATVVPVIDAKRGLIYCGFYSVKGKRVRRLSAHMLLSKEELFSKLRPGSLLVGDALALYGDDCARCGKGLTLLEKDYWYPRGTPLIAAALEKINRDDVTDAFNVKPEYLYPKECQIRGKGQQR